jgi:Holliday junction resolvasome RuvABC ATP-dependent DNA helicase subunit
VREAGVLNVLLGKETSEDYYNGLFRGPDTLFADVTGAFETIIDLAIQLHGVEQGTAYDDKTDPVVGCFESLGHAILAAHGGVNQLELDQFSKYTTIAHSKAARLYQRIKSIADGLTDNIEPQKEVPKLVKAADKITLTDKTETQVNGVDQAPDAIQKYIAELHALVGLASVKGEVEILTNLAKVFSIRKQRGLPLPDLSFHMVFSGNPGTGKTTVARIVAKVYGCLGLLSKGQLIEVDRSGLVGNFVGQTATKTKKVIDSAKGGILFIDEAYALARETGTTNDFGPEAIEVILKSMEDCRDDLVIIAAGYTNRMSKFLESNPGLRSRFPRVVTFPDYSAEELEEIFRREADRNQYRIDDGAIPALKEAVAGLWHSRGPDFANAREVRNLFERVVEMQANRISQSASITTGLLTTIVEADIRQGARVSFTALASSDNSSPDTKSSPLPAEPAIIRSTSGACTSSTRTSAIPPVAGASGPDPAPRAGTGGASRTKGGNKTEVIAALLRREDGCTSEEVLRATGWTAVSMPQQAKQAGIVLRIDKSRKPFRYYATGKEK